MLYKITKSYYRELYMLFVVKNTFLLSLKMTIDSNKPQNIEKPTKPNRRLELLAENERNGIDTSERSNHSTQTGD